MATRKRRTKSRTKKSTKKIKLIKNWKSYFQPHVTKTMAMKVVSELSDLDPRKAALVKR